MGQPRLASTPGGCPRSMCISAGALTPTCQSGARRSGSCERAVGRLRRAVLLLRFQGLADGAGLLTAPLRHHGHFGRAFNPAGAGRDGVWTTRALGRGVQSLAVDRALAGSGKAPNERGLNDQRIAKLVEGGGEKLLR